MTTFREGDIVENIDGDSERYGEQATVIYANGESVSVQYADGYVGKAKTGSRYYKKVNVSGYRAGSNRFESGAPKTGMINNIAAFVQNMTRSAEDRDLIKAGLMSECGLYTQTAIEVAGQELAASKKDRLVEVARAILADRKEKKAEAE